LAGNEEFNQIQSLNRSGKELTNQVKVNEIADFIKFKPNSREVKTLYETSVRRAMTKQHLRVIKGIKPRVSWNNINIKEAESSKRILTQIWEDLHLERNHEMVFKPALYLIKTHDKMAKRE